MTEFDTIVVGLGGAGSAAAYHLARSGSKVLGLEQFGPNHPNGSSHGRTRIFRTAYYEGAFYVPLVQRAQELWNELQTSTDAPIIARTGGLIIGSRKSPAVSGALRSAAAAHLDHELLPLRQVEERFPQFRLRDDEVAVWDPNAGALFPEHCIEAHCAGAILAGAELHYGERTISWSAEGDGVTVRTPGGEYSGRSLVLAAGAWTAGLTRELALPLTIERQFVAWYPTTDADLVRPDRMPVFIWERGAEAHTYGLPDFGDGVKVGSWAGRVASTPEDVDRTLAEAELEPVRAFVRTSLRGVGTPERESATCLFTNAPDHNFLIGVHPRHARVVVVSACSGHGFKFASVVGEVASHLARSEEAGFDLSTFAIGRFRPA